MYRMSCGIAVLAAALALTPGAQAHNLSTAQQAQPSAPPAQPSVRTTDLGDGIYMIQGRGGNVGVLAGEDGVFVIDSQFPEMAPAILAAIDELAGETPRYLVNTHWHGDHVGGNETVAATGATVIAHDNVRKRVSTDSTGIVFGEERTTPAAPEGAWPVITFSDTMTLHLNGQTVRLIHTANSHTDGDTFIVFEDANIIHTGDLMFNGSFPFIDVSSGGTFSGYMAANRRLASLADAETKLIPGHGPLGDVTDLDTIHDMLNDVVATIEPLVAEGKTLAEIRAENPLSGFAETWGGGFISTERMTWLVYTDLTRDD